MKIINMKREPRIGHFIEQQRVSSQTPYNSALEYLTPVGRLSARKLVYNFADFVVPESDGQALHAYYI